jgi:hypothetical protein
MTKDDLVSKDTALKMAIEAMDDSMIVCENLHHAKKDQHKYNEKCPVEKRWIQTINACKEALEQERKQFNFDAQFDSGVINND